MDHFKGYFILIIALVMFGCTTEESPEPDAPPAGADGGDTSEATEVESKGYDYTISVADGSEFTYVYYSVKNPLPLKEERFFKLDKGHCLRMRGDQFANLSIFASKGTVGRFFRGGDNSVSAKELFTEDSNYSPLCNSLFICNPDNYTVVPRDAGIMEYARHAEQFILLPVEVEVFGEHCSYYYHLDKWMEFKVRQYVLGGEAGQGNVDPTLKAQLEEWIVK